MSGLEQPYVQDAFATNWIAPLGSYIDAFEQEFAADLAPCASLAPLPAVGHPLALAWVGGLPGGALAAALLPPLGALLLWWGVGRVEAAARSS